MSVVVETTLGDITVDLFTKERPRACQNFLKLCKIKYYNFNLFHTVSRRFIAQTGDPTGSRNGGESIFGVLDGPSKRFFVAETNPRIKHTVKGLISFVGNEENMIGSQFFFTLSDDLTYLDDKHCVFGEVAEGLDVLDLINEAICDSDDRPYQDIRITHTVILDDPLPDLKKMVIPSRSPSPSAERLQGGRIAPDEEIDDIAGKSAEEINEMIAEREAKARATILEMVGDLPDAEMAPPENVLFVCKLNPVTSDDDLEIIFSRFGKIKSCEVIRDHKTGESLQYAFIEFEDKKSCEDAYFKMDNVLIDDRRIHVDFSQSVSKVKWMGKGRGVKHFPENGANNKNNRTVSDKQSRNFHKHEQKDSGRYDNSTRHQRRNRTASSGRNKEKYYRQSRSLSPKSRSRSEGTKTKSKSNKHNKTRPSRSGSSSDRSLYKYKKNQSNSSDDRSSRSVSPNPRSRSERTKSKSTSNKYKKSKTRHSRSGSRSSPDNKKSRGYSSDGRRSRSTSSDPKKRSSTISKSKLDKHKISRTRRSRSGSENERAPTKYGKTRGSNSSNDSAGSLSPKYKKSKSKRNISKSPEDRSRSKRRSSSSEIKNQKRYKRSETPEYKRNVNRSKSPKDKNKSKRNRSETPEIRRKKNRSKSPKGRKQSERNRSSSREVKNKKHYKRSQTPEIRRRKNRSKSPEYRNKSKRSTSREVENKKHYKRSDISSKRNRSKSPKDRNKSKRSRSSSSEVENKMYHKRLETKSKKTEKTRSTSGRK